MGPYTRCAGRLWPLLRCIQALAKQTWPYGRIGGYKSAIDRIERLVTAVTGLLNVLLQGQTLGQA